MSAERPAFIITIDTEGDDLWARSHSVSTRNSAYLPRFQGLCERYRLRPTYLVDWEMTHCPVFREFGRDLIARGAGEIGMHLHAWNTPPLVPLTDDDDRHHPFLIEYPRAQMRDKIAAMTDALEHAFQTKMVSHRAGRFMFDHTYAGLLAESGYLVDCSVAPHVSLKGKQGAPGGKGGVDYSHYSEAAYFVDLEAIERRGESKLLEVPITVLAQRYAAVVERIRKRVAGISLCRRAMQRLFPQTVWLRPNGRNRKTLLSIAARAHAEGRDHVEFFLHSSELMPAGSPTFPSPQSIDRLYADLEALFSVVTQNFEGLTLSNYYDRFVRRQAGVAGAFPPAGAHRTAAVGRQR